MIFHFEKVSNKAGGIYEIYNSHSKRYYIGQTKRAFKKRWNDYRCDLPKPIQRIRSSSNIFLKLDYQKCKTALGHDDFLVFRVIELVPDHDLLGEKEKHYIDQYRQLHGKANVYNIHSGGAIHTEEVVEKIKRKLVGKRMSVKTEFKAGQTMEERFGFEKVAEVKEKMRAAHLGISLTEGHKKAIAKAHKAGHHYLRGKTMVEVFGESEALTIKTKIAAAKKGKPSNRLGTKHVSESIAKMRTAHLGRVSGMKNPNAKVYDLIGNPLRDPHGELFSEVSCLNDFCKTHKLTPSALSMVLNGKAKTHKGWMLASTYQEMKTKTEARMAIAERSNIHQIFMLEPVGQATPEKEIRLNVSNEPPIGSDQVVDKMPVGRD